MKKILTIARYTFVEIYKSRIMINVLLIGLSILLASYIAAEFTFGVPSRVSLDFGLGLLTLSAVGIAIFMGVGLISKEVENRTVYMILSRPVSRFQFMVGRIAGMGGILFMNTLFLSLFMFSAYLYYDGVVDNLIYWATFFAFLEAMLCLLVVVGFSLVTNPTMSVIYTICCYILGHAISGSLSLLMTKQNPVILNLIKGYSFFFPDFSSLDIKSYLLYNQALSLPYLFKTTSYGVVYALFLLWISCLIFRKKNLD